MSNFISQKRFFFISLMLFAALFIGCAETIVIRTAPPPLQVYEQPYCPGPGYIWVPGYWAYSSEDYYWVPGIWELPPRIGWLWTPGYWGWTNGEYIWHGGYWGRHMGYYGGINYGYGYCGAGYEGGYWRDRVFYYNSAVTNVNASVVNNTYKKEVVVNNKTTVSYNGGSGGVLAKPSAQEVAAAHESHIGPTSNQKQLHKSLAPKRVKKIKRKIREREDNGSR